MEAIVNSDNLFLFYCLSELFRSCFISGRSYTDRHPRNFLMVSCALELFWMLFESTQRTYGCSLSKTIAMSFSTAPRPSPAEVRRFCWRYPHRTECRMGFCRYVSELQKCQHVGGSICVYHGSAVNVRQETAAVGCTCIIIIGRVGSEKFPPEMCRCIAVFLTEFI